MKQQVSLVLEEVAFKIGTLRKAKNLFSDRLAPEFNIFDYLRTDEMGLSICISNLLNPKGKHGQGSVFLDTFLNFIGPTAAWAKSSDSCVVSTEKQANGQRRIDIYLTFPKGVIGIENKPWAECQDKQLSDYADYLEKVAGNKKWLLLFFGNREPSTNSITLDKRQKLSKEGQYIPFNYSEIIEWLEVCVCKSKALIVRIFIEELIKYIRTNINGELDMTEEKEMKSVILKTTANLESAFHIFKAMGEIREELLENFHKDLQEKLESQGMGLEWNLKGWRPYIGFNILFNEQLQNLSLRFAFDRSQLGDFIWGIARKNEKFNDADLWVRINQIMSKEFGGKKSSSHWPWYSDMPDDEFDIEMKNWWSSEKPWVLIKEGHLAKNITDLALRTRDAFSENLNLLSNEASPTTFS